MNRRLWTVCALGLVAAVRVAAQDPAPPPAEPVPPAAIDLKPVECPPPAPSSGDAIPLKAVWKNGLYFESEDKAYSLFVGGRAQFDVANFIAPRGLRNNIPGTNRFEDGVFFRRARLDAGGTLGTSIDYLVQFDFVNSQVTNQATNTVTDVPAPTDLWVTFKDVPGVGNIRIGNHKPPLSFEHLTSSRFLNFLERSLAFDAFVENFNNGFAPGVSVFDTYADKRGTWAVGFFKQTRSIFAFNVGRNEHDLITRVTALPVWEDDGCRLVHVGLGAAYRDLDDDQQRFRARFDVRNSPSALSPLAADTGLIFGSRQSLLVPELAAVSGPFSMQAEWYLSWVTDANLRAADGTRGTPAGTVFTHGGYVEGHYFLTGEHRAYKREAGVFDRVKPLRPLDYAGGRPVRGLGAWQATARYTYLHLDSGVVRGGTVNDLTLGLNWFVNGNVKVQFNGFLADRDVLNPAGDGTVYGSGVRLAWDF